MLENKVVSVIVPVYNCENVIGRCIKSIQLQTYASLEIILVDDGALDDSGKICDEFAGQDVRIRVIHKKNGGVSSARNQGINTATGSFVMFVDSDDYLEKDYIEKMMMARQQNDAELVIGGYTFTDDQEKSGHFCAPMYFENKEQFLDKFDILYGDYFLHVVWNKLFLREKISASFTEGLSLGEDCIFVFDYLQNVQKIAVTDCTGYYYIIDSTESLTKKYRKDAFDIAEKIFSRVMKYISESDGSSKKGEKSACEIFLKDVGKNVREICGNKEFSSNEKRQYLQKIAESENFRYAEAVPCGIGKGEKLIFSFLKKKCFIGVEVLQMLLGFWRAGSNGHKG